MESLNLPIYLDYHSTTPVDPRVIDAMVPFFTTHFGNAASRSHPFGWKAAEAVEIARANVAKLIHVNSDEVYFTSGATEGLNMAIKGLAENLAFKGKHIISIASEHHAVLDPLQWLVKKGYDVEILNVDKHGMLDPVHLQNAIRKDTIMIVVMWANNETGVIQNVRKIGESCRNGNIAFVCDATQAAGKISIDMVENDIDIAVLTAHKMYGPKGTGAIYIAKNKKQLHPAPLIHGGGHENGYRSGTLNVPGIAGLGKAAELCLQSLNNDINQIGALRDFFEKEILEKCEHVLINGSIENRLHSVSNLRVAHVDSQAVMTRLRSKISISSGSACSSADPSPSHVLLAMGLSPADAKGSFRISFGRQTTKDEVSFAAASLAEAINEYREQSPVWQMFKKGINLEE